MKFLNCFYQYTIVLRRIRKKPKKQRKLVEGGRTRRKSVKKVGDESGGVVLYSGKVEKETKKKNKGKERFAKCTYIY